MAEAVENLPLFPLNAVLMPFMLMPLRIFEDRYKQMLQECLEKQTGWGVVLIRSGREVGGSAIPHSVGTRANPLQVRSLGEEYLVHVVGDWRFRILHLTQEEPFLRAQVEPFGDADVEQIQEHLEEVKTLRQLGERYIQIIAAAREQPPEEVPDDPLLLSWFLAARLPFDNAQRQALLETTSLVQRVQVLREFLQRQMPQIERNAALIFQMRQIRKGNGQPFRVQGSEAQGPEESS